jgi:DNA adenine methylase
MSEYCKQPLTRWIGGKRRLASRILSFFPEQIKDYEYFEPFAGAGSLFWMVSPNRSVLGDINKELINCYQCIKDSHREVFRELLKWQPLINREKYAQARATYNSTKSKFKKAALFLFLNRTSFNGIYRVNRNGDYNVPFGGINNPKLPTLGELEYFSERLSSVQLFQGDFEETIERCGRNSFVYFDPPYQSVSKTAFFVHYSADRFSYDDHFRLSKCFRQLDRKGCRLLLTCSDTPDMHALYRGLKITKLQNTRYVAAKGRRYKVSDLLIMNY